MPPPLFLFANNQSIEMVARRKTGTAHSNYFQTLPLDLLDKIVAQNDPHCPIQVTIDMRQHRVVVRWHWRAPPGFFPNARHARAVRRSSPQNDAHVDTQLLDPGPLVSALTNRLNMAWLIMPSHNDVQVISRNLNLDDREIDMVHRIVKQWMIVALPREYVVQAFKDGRRRIVLACMNPDTLWHTSKSMVSLHNSRANGAVYASATKTATNRAASARKPATNRAASKSTGKSKVTKKISKKITKKTTQKTT